MLVKRKNKKGEEKISTFHVIRFGVLKGDDGSYSVVGLSDSQTHTARWSQASSNYKGAWHVFKKYLIHNGPIDPENTTYSARGCMRCVIEINGEPLIDL